MDLVAFFFRKYGAPAHARLPTELFKKRLSYRRRKLNGLRGSLWRRSCQGFRPWVWWGFANPSLIAFIEVRSLLEDLTLSLLPHETSVPCQLARVRATFEAWNKIGAECTECCTQGASKTHLGSCVRCVRGKKRYERARRRMVEHR